MHKLIFNIKWLWIFFVSCLILLIGITHYAIYKLHGTNQFWEEKFQKANTQYILTFKNEPIVLDENMNEWLKANKDGKYVRVVIRGYGSHAELANAGGVITPSVKIFFLRENEIRIEGSILYLPQGIFCSNWDIIPISAQEYIFYKNKY